MSNAAPSSEPLILSRREGAITRITLNRPRAINALNSEMFADMSTALETAQSDGSATIVIDGAGERGLCGGGDIKEISSGDAASILSREYELDLALAMSPVPVVGFMDGITMGGGIGITGHARFRVVTERSRLAMPEARIGIVPDVGGHLLLANAPGRLGELLAVTSGEMTGGDAIALGFADCFVPSERLEALREALASGEPPRSACERFAEPAPPSPMLEAREWWEPIAERALGGAGAVGTAGSAGEAGWSGEAEAPAEPVAAAIRLLHELEASPRPEAHAALAAVRGMCPMSIAVTLAQIDRTRRLGLDLAAVLADDLRVLGRLTARADFAEGVRAQVVDKDRDPRWRPASLEELDPSEVAEVLAA